MTRPVVTAAETDAVLVEAARSVDIASYGLLVERHQPVAHRTAFALGAGDDTAYVVQEAFVKAYLALDRFQVTDPFRRGCCALWSTRRGTGGAGCLGTGRCRCRWSAMT
jgi:hypothetical protein